MAYPIVHLAIAARYAARWPQADAGSLLLGALAPDAYHGRPDGGTLKDRQATHLEAKDTIIWRENVRSLCKGRREPLRDGFFLGYLVHLLTDILWQETAHARHAALWQAGPVEGVTRYRAYAADMARYDVRLYSRLDVKSTIFPILAAAKPQGLSPFVTAGEVAQEQGRTLPWYDAHMDFAEKPPLLLGDDVLDAFYAKAVTALEGELAGCGIEG